MAGCTLGYYGKLPLSPEFIRSNAAGAEVQDLDQWFQEGIHHGKLQLGASWSSDFAQSDPWNFLFCPEGGSRFLVGVVKASHDQAGREFPFFLFLLVETAHFHGQIWIAPLRLKFFLSQCREMVQSGWMGTDLKDFRSHLDGFQVPDLSDAISAEDSYREDVRKRTAQEFWTGVLGDFQHPNKYFLDHSLMMCLGPLRHQPSKRLAWGLKFPLLRDCCEETYDVPFWLEMCARWLGYKREATMLLWNRTPSKVKPCMMAAFGKPASNLVLFLIRPDRKDTAWYDLSPAHLEDQPDLVAKLKSHRRELLEDIDLSMEIFLERTGEVTT